MSKKKNKKYADIFSDYIDEPAKKKKKKKKSKQKAKTSVAKKEGPVVNVVVDINENTISAAVALVTKIANIARNYLSDENK